LLPPTGRPRDAEEAEEAAAVTEAGSAEASGESTQETNAYKVDGLYANARGNREPMKLIGTSIRTHLTSTEAVTGP
jgi:hypothetical protein